jgi:hypothetical protein
LTIGSWGEQISDSDIPEESAACISLIVGVYVRIPSGTDGDDSDGDGGNGVDGDGDDGDGVGDGDHSTTVPVVLSQVGWLHQGFHPSFHRLRAFYQPKLPQTRSMPLGKCRWTTMVMLRCSSVTLGAAL